MLIGTSIQHLLEAGIEGVSSNNDVFVLLDEITVVLSRHIEILTDEEIHCYGEGW
jgi:hypothetical protein